VVEKLGLSYSNIYGLHKLIDGIPERYGMWKTYSLLFKDSPQEYIVRMRDPVEAIKCLWRDTTLTKHMVYVPKKVFSDANKENRIFSEM
jgi:Plavaka transposase